MADFRSGVPPLATLAAQAVTNFGDHNFTLVKQAKGWCNYPFDEVAI